MDKGQVNLNWIFIIIVGAIFLVFFTGFAFKYKEIQDKKTEIIVLNNIETALTNLRSSSFTTTTRIDLPLSINVGCDNKGFNIFMNEKNYINHLVSSRNRLDGKMNIWYQPYKIPFRVADFYYLIDNSKVKVNSNFYEDIVNELPEAFKSRVVRDVNGISIQGDMNEGTVNGIKYIGKEMLFAGIFSDNYKCFYDAFKEELKKSILVYQGKAGILSRSGCNYNLILSRMNMLNDFDNVNYNIIGDLDRLNRNLASLNCPSLF